LVAGFSIKNIDLIVTLNQTVPCACIVASQKATLFILSNPKRAKLALPEMLTRRVYSPVFQEYYL